MWIILNGRGMKGGEWERMRVVINKTPASTISSLQPEEENADNIRFVGQIKIL